MARDPLRGGAPDPLRGGGRERLARTSSPPREPSRPSRLRIWLKRRKPLMRPGLYGALALGVVALAVQAVRAVDPAGRVRGAAEALSGIGEGLGLTVQHVILEGRRNTPTDMIRAALGVARGDPILDFSPEDARARLETIAWVQRAHVERRLPGTILVRIDERRPFAIWQNGGRFVIVDREGKTVAADGLDQFGPLPLLVGVGAETEVPAEIRALAAERQAARQARDFTRADRLRQELRERGWLVEDTPQGPRLKRA